jgi:hypothetical protein
MKTSDSINAGVRVELAPNGRVAGPLEWVLQSMREMSENPSNANSPRSNIFIGPHTIRIINRRQY